MAHLIVKASFSAFGVDFNPGDTVTAEQAASWPEGTLQRRMDSGDVGFSLEGGDGTAELAEAAATAEALQAEVAALTAKLAAVDALLTDKQREKLATTPSA